MSKQPLRVQASLTSTGFSTSPQKKLSATGARSTNGSAHKISSLALTMNPSLSANSDFATRLSTGNLSVSKDGIHLSARSSKDNHNNIYHEKAKASIYKSPDKHKKTISLMSPSKSSNSLLGTTIASHKQQPSEVVIQRLQDLRQVRDEKKQMGTEVFETLNQRKVIENQVKTLETRVKRLQQEEQEMTRKINDTTEKTEKILEMKKKHQEHLAEKAARSQNKEDTTSKRRQEINQEREDTKSHLRQAKMSTFKNKHDTAYSVKQENETQKALKQEKEEGIMEKNRQTISKIRDTHAEFKETFEAKISARREENS